MEALTTTAASISARFLARGLEEKRQITHLKLQKLVTLAESLAEYAVGQPAFPEDVQAWKNGPAVKAIFGRYKDFGDAPITAVDSAASIPVPADLLRIIDEVWGVAGQLTPAELWTLTHSVGPWETYYVPGVKDIVIPGAELGKAWPDYVDRAYQLSHRKSPANTPIVGRGQQGFASAEDFDAARARFRPSKTAARGG